jgi:hypothetical protein
MSSCGFNLIRNARMFFTTNVNTETGVVKATGFTKTNTKEIQVLDGLSFSQNTTAETVTINEAGDSPTRGQRNFNTALDPVELSFSTYMRPYFKEGATVNTAYDSDDTVEAEEDVLWNAFAAGYVNGTSELIGGATAAWTKTVGAALTEPHSDLSFQFSNKNQLQKFGVIIVLDSTSYVIDNCVLDQASIDFGIDAIATIAWTARGSVIRAADIYATEPTQLDGTGTVYFYGSYIQEDSSTLSAVITSTSVDITTDIITTGAAHGLRKGQEIQVQGTSTIGGVGAGTYWVLSTPTSDTFTISDSLANYTAGTAVDLTGAGALDYKKYTHSSAATGKNTVSPFLANKLSVVEVLKAGINGAGTNYTLALTGGNITLSNNVTYLTPANLGVVNKPFTYFTGTRAVSGSLNCYLKTGSMNSGKLLDDLIEASATNVDPAYNLQLSIGAPNTSGKTRVVLHMPATVLTIPTINTEQVVSTTINFTAQGYTDDEFDICANNEISIKYYSANTTP